MWLWDEELVLKKHFLQKLELSDITSLHINEDSPLVKQYRTVSVLPTALKMSGKKMIQKQINVLNNFYPVVIEKDLAQKGPMFL